MHRRETGGGSLSHAPTAFYGRVGGCREEKTRWWARQASHEWAAGEVAARGGGWGPADRDSSGSGGV